MKIQTKKREYDLDVMTEPITDNSRFLYLAILILVVMAWYHVPSMLAKEAIVVVPEVSDNVDINADDIAIANEMLEGSRMQGLGEMIVTKSNEAGVSWRIVIGIAEAESNMGDSFVYEYDHKCHNYWGIKPLSGRRADGSYLRCYNEDVNGVNSIVGLLARRYKGQTPEEMCGVYVVPCNPNWLTTINKFY